MEKPHYLPNEHLEQANIRMGAIIKKTLPVLTTAYEHDEWLTVGEIERRIPFVSAGVRSVVHRLNELYVFTGDNGDEDKNVELLISDYHPSLTWIDRSGNELPATVYSLTEPGYGWARFAINSIVLAGDRKINNKMITNDLRRRIK
jgi:hypothetical protein